MKQFSTLLMGIAALSMFGACALYGLLLALPEATICDCPDSMPQCERNEVVHPSINGEEGCIDVDILCELRSHRAPD